MTAGFPRSIRVLSSDNRKGRWRSALIAAALLLCWGAWLFFSEVTLYVKTDQARLEVTGLPHPVESQVAGRVLASHLVLGQRVAKGDLLLVVDARAFTLELAVVEARNAGLREELAALGRVLEAERKVIGELDHAYRAMLGERRMEHDKASSDAAFATDKANRMSGLTGHSIRELDVMNAEADAAGKRADALAKQFSVKALSANKETEKIVRLAHIAELEKEQARLGGELATSEAAAEKLRDQIEQHRVLAPVAGQIGEISALVQGAYVQAGERVATVIPGGELVAVARFAAYESVGRIKPGQVARLRLAAFPWTRYGSVLGTVSSVATEPREGLVQVEMRVDRKGSTRIPYQHGLNGTLEIAVERVSPAEIVLRSAGRLLTGAAPIEAGQQGATGGSGRAE
ncbi:MAG: HlyD family secretion protein [Myxococcota bacterium]|jgi:membrane fusion protein (multidrug efflux system)|nr:HlyD family secretion protein [Myxococcota bacterium]